MTASKPSRVVSPLVCGRVQGLHHRARSSSHRTACLRSRPGVAGPGQRDLMALLRAKRTQMLVVLVASQNHASLGFLGTSLRAGFRRGGPSKRLVRWGWS